LPEAQAPRVRVPQAGPARDDQGPGDVLARIVATKRREIAELLPRLGEIRARAEAAPGPRDFTAALRRPGSVALIAEVKRRSPGAGAIRPDLDPAELAAAYVRAGAAAVSVLTDREYFQGSLEDLTHVREAVAVPVLRKDFMVSEAQVWEARAAGADAILLIVRILEDGELAGLRALAERLGMAALVEVHDRSELRRALDAGARIVGINNRDLSTFETTIGTTLELAREVPEGVTLVSESGIRGAEDVGRLGAEGVDAVLVGEALLRAASPAEKSRELSGLPRKDAPGRSVEREDLR